MPRDKEDDEEEKGVDGSFKWTGKILYYPSIPINLMFVALGLLIINSNLKLLNSLTNYSLGLK